MAFDIDGALKAGASPKDIADFLSSKSPDFDVAGARKAGASDMEIAQFLSGRQAKASAESADAVTSDPMGNVVYNDASSGPRQNLTDGLGRKNGRIDVNKQLENLGGVMPYELHDAVRRAYDAASPEDRKKLMTSSSSMMVRSAARAIDKQYKAMDEGLGKDVLGNNIPNPFDSRVESRRKRLIADGLDSSAAEGKSKVDALFGSNKRVSKVGESDFDFETSKALDPSQPVNGLNNPLVRGVLKGGAGLTKAVTGYGEALADLAGLDGAADVLKKASGKVRGFESVVGEKGTTLERNFEGAVNSLTQMIPSFTMGAVTGAAAVPLASIAFSTFGQEYSDGKSGGLNPEEAAARAGLMAAFEVIGESVGFKGNIKAIREAVGGLPLQSVVTFLGNTLKKEVPGEVLTTTGQFLTDKLPGIGQNQNAGIDDYLKQVGDTIVQTVLQGGIQSAGGAAVGKAVSAYNNRGTPEQQLARAIDGIQLGNASSSQVSSYLDQVNTASRGEITPAANTQMVGPRAPVGLINGALTPTPDPIEVAAQQEQQKAAQGQQIIADANIETQSLSDAVGQAVAGASLVADVDLSAPQAAAPAPVTQAEAPAVASSPVYKTEQEAMASAMQRGIQNPVVTQTQFGFRVEPSNQGQFDNILSSELYQGQPAGQSAPAVQNSIPVTQSVAPNVSQNTQVSASNARDTATSQGQVVRVGADAATDATGLTIGDFRSYAKALGDFNSESGLRNFGPNDGPAEAYPVAPEKLQELTPVARVVKDVFGKQVVFYEGPTGQNGLNNFRGVFLNRNSDRAYVEVNNEPQFVLATTFHELDHALENSNPDAHTQWRKQLLAVSDFDSYLDNYTRKTDQYAKLTAGGQQLSKAEFQSLREATRNEAEKEFAANFAGSQWADKTFIQRLVMSNPGKFSEIAKTVIGEINKILSKIKALYVNPLIADDSRVSQYVRDLEKARDEYIKYLNTVTGDSKSSSETDSEGVSFASRSGSNPVTRGGTVSEIGQYKVRTQKDGTIGVAGDPEEIRKLIPENVRGRVVEGGVVFTTSDAPRVKAALEGRNIAYSRGGEVLDKLPMKGGKYVGAPDKYNTPGKITKLREQLKKLTTEGERGRYWYENSSRAVLDMTGGNVQEARKFVALLAIYSPQAKVDANTTFALRAWAQYKAGQPIRVKTKVMDDKATAALDDIDAFWSGEKTGNFFFNLLREIDPSTKGKRGATIDMWMMRAAEYSSDAPTSTQYAFMENETNRIAQELGWEPQQVQAAIWVAMKARMESDGVKKNTETSSEKKGWLRYDYPLKKGVKTKTRVILNAQQHRDNWLKHALGHTPTTEDTQKAKFDFSDGLRRHMGQLSWEARPGRSTGVLSGIHDAPYEQQVEFQQAVQKALLDDNGIDLVAYKLGMLVDGPDILAPGVWQGDVAAGMQKKVVMAPAAGDDGKRSIDPAQKQALDAYVSILGLLLKQEGVGYHRPFYKGRKSDENAVEIDVGRPLTQTEAQSLWGAIDSLMKDNGYPNWETGAGLVSSPNGMRVVNLGAVEDNAKFRDLIDQAAETIALDEVSTDYFSTDGALIENSWKESPNGESYQERIRATGSPDLLGWVRDVLAPRVQSVLDEYSSKYGWGNPGTIQFSRRDGSGRISGAGAQDRDAVSEQSRASGRSASGFESSPLPEAPRVKGFYGPDPRLVGVAKKYAQENGIDLRRQAEYVDVDPDRASRIADAYAAMKHAPQDPVVKEAYQNLIRQTVAQFKALESAGYKFWFIDLAKPGNTDYAASPWNAMRDIRANKQMGIFRTADGFGSNATELDVNDNPLLADTGMRWPVGGVDSDVTAPVLANDVFRAVHDAFGHGLEGAGFRARGEENAWQAHIRLFTGSAKGAITSETRGQNSWLNYGPYGETNRNAQVEDTVFADQKTGLMPEWTWTEGIADDMPSVAKLNRRQTETPEFKQWFGDWQALKAQSQIDQSAVVTIEIPPEWMSLSKNELRTQVALVLDRMVKQKAFIKHPELGIVYVGQAGKKKTISQSPDVAKLLIAANLEQVFPESIVINTEPGDRQGVVQRYTLAAKVQIGDTEVVALFAVNRQRDGNWYYNTVVVADADQKRNDLGAYASSGAVKSPLEQTLLTEVASFIRRPFVKVNPESVSKVVDAEGRPLVVYHGTRSDFDAFDPQYQSQGKLGKGFYFSPSKSTANLFAKIGGLSGMDAAPKVFPVYLSIKNPAVFDLEQMPVSQISQDRLVEQGYDGALLLKNGNVLEIAAFSPNQIKSAIGNNGQFDGSNPDIRLNSRKNSPNNVTSESSNSEAFQDATTDNPNSRFWQLVGQLRSGNRPNIRRDDVPQLYSRFKPAGRGELIGSYNGRVPTGLESIEWDVPLAGSDGFFSLGKKYQRQDGTLAFSFSFIPSEFADENWQANPKDYAAITVNALQSAFDKNRFEVGVSAAQNGTPVADLMNQRGLYEKTGQFSSGGEEYARTKIGLQQTKMVLSEVVRRLSLNIGRTPNEIRWQRDTGANPNNVPDSIDAEKIQTRFNQRGQVVRLDKQGKLDQLSADYVDKFGRVRTIQDAVKAINATPTINGREITPYEMQERFPGVRAELVSDFNDKELDPLLADLKKAKVSVDRLMTYMYARHAPERNRSIARINKGMPDGGSGMTTQVARDLLAGQSVSWVYTDADGKTVSQEVTGFKPDEIARLRPLADKVSAIIQGTRDILRNSGLETPATMDAVEAAYKYYVPLIGEFGDDDTFTPSSGYSVKGSVIKQALGTKRAATSILAQIANAREMAISRFQKNEVAKELLLYIDRLDQQGVKLENENGEKLFEINPVDQIQYFKKGKLTDYRAEASAYYKLEPDVLSIAEIESYINGQYFGGNASPDRIQQFVERNKGKVDFHSVPEKYTKNTFNVRINGQDVLIRINDSATADAVRNIGAVGMNESLPYEVSRQIIQWERRVYTGINPEFWPINFLRDLESTLVYSLQNGAKAPAYILKNMPTALKDAFNANLRGVNSADWDMYRLSGSRTGYVRSYKNLQERNDMMAKIVGDQGSIGRTMAGVVALVRGLEAVGSVFEDTMRYALWRSAKDQGMTAEQAATVVRKVAVNFNRKGFKTEDMSSLWLFFNSQIQGTKNMFDALTSKKVLTAVGSLTAAYAGYAFMAAALLGSDDDDEPLWNNETVRRDRQNNLLIPTGNKEQPYIKIPVQYGLNLIMAPGNAAAGVYFANNKGAQTFKETMDVLGAISKNIMPMPISNLFEAVFNGVSNGKSVDESFGVGAVNALPTALSQIMQLVTGKNNFGGDISPNSYGKPDSETMRRGMTGTAYESVAKGLNKITGGDKYESGAIDVSPDTLKFITNQVFGSFFGGAVESVSGQVGMEKDKVNTVPVVRRFVADPDQIDQSDLAKFYDAKTRLEQFAKRAKDMKPEDRMEARNEPLFEAKLRLAKKADKVKDKLSKINKDETKLRESDASDGLKKNGLRQLFVRRQKVIDEFNKEYAKVNR